MRVFFDTNILISAFTARGLCAELYERVALNHHLIIGKPVIKELTRILTGKLRVPSDKLQSVLHELDGFEQAPDPVINFELNIKDSDDVLVIACAIAAKADVFISGDKELLKLAGVNGMPILSPRQFWLQLAGLES